MKIQIQYYAALREHTKQSSEELDLEISNAAELYEQLQKKYNFSFAADQLRVAINDKFATMTSSLTEGDRIVFIPPVAGG